MQITKGIVAAYAVALLGTSAFGAETLRSTSVFEKPSISSHQIDLLPPHATLDVTGEQIYREDWDWLPVQIGPVHGWVIKNQLKLAEKDVGYEAWAGKNERSWLWISGGYAFMNSTEFFAAKRIAIGYDYFVNDMRRFFIGTTVTTEFSDEKLSISGDGLNQRYNTYLSLGYLLLPDRVYTRFGLGLSPLAGANRNFSNKLGASAFGELGYHVSLGNTHKLGISFLFEYTGKSRQSVNFIQDLYHCIAGGCDASRSVPSATIFAINATYFFAP